MKLFEQVLVALAEGRPVAVATVVATAGSTPRHPGARMAVSADGTSWGTIGGGRIELEVSEAARAVAEGGPARRVRHHLVRDLAMCCGGSMELVIAPAAPSALALEQAAAARRDRQPVLLDTPLDGAAMTARPVSRADARPWRHPVIEDGVLREVVGLRERVLVFGAGHVGRAVGELLARCDFDVVLCDDGDTRALVAPALWASEVVESFEVGDVAAQLGGIGAGDLVLIVTRDHAVDQRILEQLFAGPTIDDADFVGMIGSRGKVGRFRKRLEAKGLLDGERGAARWARLHAPVGLDLGAETPEEIAIAVAAQLIAQRRRGEPAAGGWRRGDDGAAE